MESGEQKEERWKKLCHPAEQKNDLRLYQLKTQEIIEDTKHHIQVLSVGPQSNGTSTKSVLLLGETGAGKTLLINGFINHLFGVEFSDSFRLYLKDQIVGEPRKRIHSQTDYITVYKINYQQGMKYKSDFIFIDTPGINDTRGENYQESYFRMLSTFFLGNFEINELHCIGMVVKASTNRITKDTVCTFKELKSMLGRDCNRIMQLLCTHGLDGIPVREVAIEAEIEFINDHEFDNLLIFCSNHPNSYPNKMYQFMIYRWDAMAEEYSKFLNNLMENNTPVSVERLRDLHRKKTELKELEVRLKTSGKSLSEMKKRVDDVTRLIDPNTEKAERIRSDWVEVKKVSMGQHFHNCKICNMSCDSCNELLHYIKSIALGTGVGITNGGAFVAAALLADVAIGAQVGAIGGPIGIVIGLGMGTIVGVTSAFNRRDKKGNCKKASIKCTNNGCTHGLNDHEESNRKIIINKAKKDLNDLIMTEVELLQIDREEINKELQEEETNCLHLITCLVSITKEISELSLGSDSVTPESIIEEMSGGSYDAVYPILLRECEENRKKLNSVTSEQTNWHNFD